MTKTAMQLGREGIGRPEVKPHQCQQCLKSFSSNHQLVQHIRSFSKIYFVKSVVFLNTILLRMRNITIINLFPHSISPSTVHLWIFFILFYAGCSNLIAKVFKVFSVVSNRGWRESCSTEKIPYECTVE